ncbi:MAG: heavy metal translocating P-type ATPase [Myxococcota bacterium]
MSDLDPGVPVKSTAFHIPKMDCKHEEKQVREALGPVPGVEELRFDLPARSLVVRHHGEASAVLAALEPLQFGARIASSEGSAHPDDCCSPPPIAAAPPSAAGMRAYKVHGMDCAEEVATLRRALNGLVAEEALGFDVLNGKMLVPSAVEESRVIAAVAATGMRAERFVEPKGVETSHAWGTRDALVVASGVGTAIGFAVHVGLAELGAAIGSEGAGLAEAVPWAARLPYLAAIVAGLWVVAPKAFYSARSLRPDMNLLMTVAVAGAITLGEWFEAATVAFLFALSLSLEAWSVGRARRAVAALMRLAPDRVRIVRGGVEVEVDPAEVEPGTLFFVRPGERIGLDGRIARGATEVDQAPITGESVPVDKAPGDEVFAGTVNGSGALDVVSTRPAGETTLARIVRQVADSQSRRSESEQWVDRFARVYTPTVLALAIAVAIIPIALGGEPSVWAYRALVLLVIGCPCALVIATPVAIVASLAASARHGVLLKGGRVAELPAMLRVVALDKTGTLTEGRPRVVEVVPLAEHDEAGLLARAAAMEARSQHPIAAAILARARELGIEAVPATDVVAVHGKGAEGTIGGRTFWVGSHRWLEERGQETPDVHARLEAMASGGRTIVVVGNQTHVCGLIAVADGIRPESIAAVAALKRAGIRRVVMLTGDNRATAEVVGAAVGVDEVRAELLPEDKVRVIEELEAAFGPTAMIGDGVNDAPALARATLGVAMGAAGTDAAIETADIALMGDDLGKLAWSIEHSRATMSVIRANTAFALGIKLLFAILTFAGFATLWGAIAADMGASLVVVFNALRLLRR